MIVTTLATSDMRNPFLARRYERDRVLADPARVRRNRHERLDLERLAGVPLPVELLECLVEGLLKPFAVMVDLLAADVASCCNLALLHCRSSPPRERADATPS